MAEVISSLVAQQITAATGLSAADFAVLAHLRASGGAKRQRDMQTFLGWDKTRLSHQVTRMEGRGLVAKNAAGADGPEVQLTTEGRRRLEEALPVHQVNVHKFFASHLAPEDIAALRVVAQKLQDAIG